MREIIGKFLTKGKHITFADVQDIVQDAMEVENVVPGGSLEVTDFEVTTGLNRKAFAKVTAKQKNATLSAEAEGVGPVDAVLNALKLACSEEIKFDLSDYKVEVRGQGADAVVNVDLTLKKDGVQSVGTGTSPDIIQASIEAFAEAYNAFLARGMK